MQDIPQALLDSLEKRKDFSKESFLRAHEEVPITSIRLNPLKGDVEAIPFTDKEPIPWNPYGYYLKERPTFIFDPLLHAGIYYVQEASSMFVWEILKQNNVKTQSKVLDLCAAPGGKTTLLASYFHDGLVVGNEVIKTRASILVENTTKWGSGNVVVSNNDPKQFAQLPGYFDVMLVDAPCSGSGLFRKEKEWRDGWSESNVELCSQRQQRILADSYSALSDDGLLIYATCSFSQKEDEDIVDWIMENLPMENIGLFLDPTWGIEETLSERYKAKSYRFYPGKTKGEGFFVAVFRKKQSAGYPHFLGTMDIPSNSENEILDRWIKDSDNLFFYQNGESFHAFPKKYSDDIKLLKNRLYLRKGGTEIGSIKGKDLIPSPELALSKLCSEIVNKIDLDKSEALQYLRKNDLERTDSMVNGWSLVTYNNNNLGWVKILPNRINNYFPMEWRIRKQ